MIQLSDGDLVRGTLRRVVTDGFNDVQIEPHVAIQNFKSARSFKLVDEPAVTVEDLERYIDQPVLVGIEDVADSVAEVIPLDASISTSFNTPQFLEGCCMIRDTGLCPGDTVERTFDTVLPCGQLYNWRDGEIAGVRLEPDDSVVPGATYQVELLRLTPVKSDSGPLWVMDARHRDSLSPPETGYSNRILVVHPPGGQERQHDIPESLEQPQPTPTTNITVHEVTEDIGYELPTSAVECRDWGLCPTRGNTVEARVTDDRQARALGMNNLATRPQEFLKQTFPVVEGESYDLVIRSEDDSPETNVEMFDIRSYDPHAQRARAVVKTANRREPSTASEEIGGERITDVLSALTCINRLSKDVDIKREYPECKQALYDVKHYVIDKLMKRRQAYVLTVRRENHSDTLFYSVYLSDDVCRDDIDTQELRYRVHSNDHDVWMYHVPRHEWPEGPPIGDLPEGDAFPILEPGAYAHSDAYRPELEQGCKHRDTLRSALGRSADPDKHLGKQDYRFAQVINDCIY